VFRKPAGGFALFAPRIRSIGAVHWLAFFGLLLLCWAVLFAMAVPAELRGVEDIYGDTLIEILCGGAMGASGLWPVASMWALMSAAMMVPTALPAFATYADLPGSNARGFWRLVAGFVTAWAGFSLVAALLQVALFRWGLVGGLGQSLSVPLSASLLILAGLYQVSPLKAACLSRCRAPLPFFMQHWQAGPWRNGLRLGWDCVGCCWALMLLGFVGGTMNLGFMGLAMLLMTLEKLPRIGALLTLPLGVGLIVAGGGIVLLS
jgi:predicted metal-binding membrane protein